jgi:hypothetical protein
LQRESLFGHQRHQQLRNCGIDLGRQQACRGERDFGRQRTICGPVSGYAVLWDIGGSPNLTVTPQGGNAGNFAVQNSGNPSLYLAAPFGHNSNNCSGQNATSCFDYAVAHKNSAGTDSTLVLDVTSSAGLALSNFVATSEGFSLAAMIYQSGNGTPFYVASNGTPVPEPQTWTMSLVGLAGLVFFQRRRKRFAKIR